MLKKIYFFRQVQPRSINILAITDMYVNCDLDRFSNEWRGGGCWMRFFNMPIFWSREYDPIGTQDFFLFQLKERR